MQSLHGDCVTLGIFHGFIVTSMIQSEWKRERRRAGGEGSGKEAKGGFQLLRLGPHHKRLLETKLRRRPDAHVSEAQARGAFSAVSGVSHHEATPGLSTLSCFLSCFSCSLSIPIPSGLWRRGGEEASVLSPSIFQGKLAWEFSFILLISSSGKKHAQRKERTDTKRSM